jgi:hypothetical protein
LANAATVFASKKTAWPLVYHIVQQRQAFVIMLLNDPPLSIDANLTRRWRSRFEITSSPPEQQTISNLELA